MWGVSALLLWVCCEGLIDRIPNYDTICFSYGHGMGTDMDVHGVFSLSGFSG
jgi:hypothetical protein